MPDMFRSGMSHQKAFSVQSLLCFETTDDGVANLRLACERSFRLSVERAEHTPSPVHWGCEGKIPETETGHGADPAWGTR